jgi:hypothetical protein
MFNLLFIYIPNHTAIPREIVILINAMFKVMLNIEKLYIGGCVGNGIIVEGEIV